MHRKLDTIQSDLLVVRKDINRLSGELLRFEESMAAMGVQIDRINTRLGLRRITRGSDILKEIVTRMAEAVSLYSPRPRLSYPHRRSSGSPRRWAAVAVICTDVAATRPF